MKAIRTSRPQTVHSGIVVAADRRACWDALVDPHILAEWFGDVVASPSVEGAVEFRFGDGDFFVTQVTVPSAGHRLHWQWRFMGVGGTSEIAFHLTDHGAHTRIEVADQGEYTDTGAQELRDGWADFIGRMKNRLETGERSRYYWSEAISTGMVTHVAIDRALLPLTNPAAWRSYFPGMSIVIRETPTALHLTFGSGAWQGRTTQADITFIDRTDGTGVAVTHSGWPDLPPDIRFAERKQAAGCWARALADIECSLAYEPCRMAITALP